MKVADFKYKQTHLAFRGIDRNLEPEGFFYLKNYETRKTI